MARPRVLVLRAPGTNCDQETAFAFEQAGAEAVRLHINQLIERLWFSLSCWCESHSP
jgi:phosphoribosylformylglycinamidine synthase subunit PurQ / glutaminase